MYFMRVVINALRGGHTHQLPRQKQFYKARCMCGLNKHYITVILILCTYYYCYKRTITYATTKSYKTSDSLLKDAYLYN